MRFSILLFSILLVYSLFSHQTMAQSTPSESANSSEQEDIRYISDELFIFMHAGPSRNFRILGSIYAGTKIAILQIDEEAGFVKVRDDRGRTGWVENDFVSPEPSIRVAHERATKRLASQETSLNSLQTQLSQALKERNEAEQKIVVMNNELSESIERNADLTTHIEQKAQIDQALWFTRGTVLALISVIIGFLLGLFARKRNKSNPLM